MKNPITFSNSQFVGHTGRSTVAPTETTHPGMTGPTREQQLLAAAFFAGRNTTGYKTGARYGQRLAEQRKVESALRATTSAPLR